MESTYRPVSSVVAVPRRLPSRSYAATAIDFSGAFPELARTVPLTFAPCATAAPERMRQTSTARALKGMDRFLGASLAERRRKFACAARPGSVLETLE